MKRPTHNMLVYLLAMTITWFPLAGFSASCMAAFPASGDAHASSRQHVVPQQSYADTDDLHYQDTSPDCPDCDTHQHDCNGNHSQCTSGITLILHSQVSIPEFTPSSWLITQNTALPGTHPAPAIRPPIHA